MNRLLAVSLLLALSACTLGPDYKRPEADLPKDFGVAQSATPAPERWWVVFSDPVLDRMEDEALANNRDLLAAAERIEQARAQLGIARADQLPSVGLDASYNRNRASQLGSFPLPSDSLESHTHRAVLSLSWELDFWGKYRRATEAARAELAASEYGRTALRSTLVGDVARGYFALRALDRRLEALDRTLLGRNKSLELQQLRLDAGVVSELELRQVEGDLRAAQAAVPLVRQQRARQEGALAVLLGRSPREVFEAHIERGAPATPLEVEVPAVLPSDLLLRRPDLREAEERLRAANARIGVARAAYFPSLSLTGFFGGESQSLGDLFTGPARVWNVTGGLLQPVFAGSQIRGGVDLANARTREAAQNYQKAIANAFREAREALLAQGNLRDADLAQREREKSLARALDLAKLRYDNGAVSLFEVLETERLLLLARLEAIDGERDRRDAIVDLYIALGG